MHSLRALQPSNNCISQSFKNTVPQAQQKMKQVIALALLSGSQALLAPQSQLKTRVAAAPVEDAEPVAPMTTLEAAVLEATGTEPAAVAPAPVAAPPVAPAAPPPAPKGRIAQKRTENWSDLALPFSGRPAILDRALAADSDSTFTHSAANLAVSLIAQKRWKEALRATRSKVPADHQRCQGEENPMEMENSHLN